MENTERTTILENVISYYSRQGYRVVLQTDNSAQLIRQKQFSVIFAIFLFLLFLLPLVIYILYYLIQRDKTIRIVVNEQGKISITDENGKMSIVDSIEQLSPLSFTNIKAENDPGYSASTIKILIILAVFMIIGLLAAIIVNFPAK